MQAFKLNLKLIWKRLPGLSIYLIVFMVISIVIANVFSGTSFTPDLFEPVRTAAVLQAGEDTALTRSLETELSKTVEFLDAPEDQETLAEMLYWGEIEYILYIPEGFTDSFMRGEALPLKQTGKDNSTATIYIEIAVQRYLSTAALYVEHLADITPEELVAEVERDLANTAEIELVDEEAGYDVTYGQYFFNYMAYSVMAILIMGMGIIVVSYKDAELKRRNYASPIRLSSHAMGFVFANVVFALVTWVVFIIACMILDSGSRTSPNMFWFVLNSFCFVLAASALSYLIGTVSKNENVIDAVSNVVSLGTAFISGVFVPQELLGGTVLSIARFTPVYWFVLANDRIAGITDFSSVNLEPVWQPMLVTLGFAVIFILIAAVVMRQQRFKYDGLVQGQGR